MPHPKGGYKLKDGTKVPGTTTIIGRFKESGGLLFWAFEQGKAAERGEINRLYDKRDSAGEAGTLAHSMVEAHIKRKEQPGLSIYTDDVIEQAKQGFENYLEWESNTKILVIHQEIELVSEAYRYGGCPDAIGRDRKGRLVLIDWKTSSKGPYTDYLLQLAAYQHLWDENNPGRPLTGGFHLCKFSKENADFSHHYWAELDLAWEQFKILRKAWDIDKQLKKRL